MAAISSLPEIKTQRMFVAAAIAAMMLLLLPLSRLWQSASTSTGGADLQSARPLSFVPYFGPESADIHYTVHSNGASIAFSDQSITFETPSAGEEPSNPIRLSFSGAAANTGIEALDPLPGVVNVYRGNDPSDWRTGESLFAAVRYASLYPGISLLYEGVDGNLKSTFTLAAGAAPSAIRWSYTGVSDLQVDAAGNLVITAEDGSTLVENAPVAWQTAGGGRIPVRATYEIGSDGLVGFRLGTYDPKLPLVIDPTIVFQTVVDLAAFEHGIDIEVDSQGNAYVASYYYEYNATGNDIQAVKFDADGDLIWVSHIAGEALDYNTSIAVDAQGNAYLTGWTTSTDLPLVNPIQNFKNGNGDLFIVKFASDDGSLAFSSYLGGNRGERGIDLIVGAGGDLYLAGRTDSIDFPVTENAVQPNLTLLNGWAADAFVLRLNAALDQIVYATYLGGAFTDEAATIGLDAAGNIYVSGTTQSDDFPLVNPIQSTALGGEFDLFAARISADGNTLDYSTYLSGSDDDYVAQSAVDAAGNQYLTGWTRSVDFPTTAGAYQPSFGGGIGDCGSPPFDPIHNCENMFITKILPDGSNFAFSTYLGGEQVDYGHGIAVNSQGDVLVAGYSYSSDYPPAGNPNFVSIVLSSLSPDGADLNWSEFLWSGSATSFHGLAVDDNDDIYLTGALNVPSDLFLIKYTEDGQPGPTATPPSPEPTATSGGRQTPTPGPTNTPGGGRQTPTPAPSNTPAPSETPVPGENVLHVSDLDGAAETNGAQRWNASVTITVFDQNGDPVAGANVSGSWSGGANGSGSCQTDANGQCTLTRNNIRGSSNSVTFTVNSVSASGYTYDPGANTDPDGDSDGTVIVVSKP